MNRVATVTAAFLLVRPVSLAPAPPAPQPAMVKNPVVQSAKPAEKKKNPAPVPTIPIGAAAAAAMKTTIAIAPDSQDIPRIQNVKYDPAARMLRLIVHNGAASPSPVRFAFVRMATHVKTPGGGIQQALAGAGCVAEANKDKPECQPKAFGDDGAFYVMRVVPPIAPKHAVNIALPLDNYGSKLPNCSPEHIAEQLCMMKNGTFGGTTSLTVGLYAEPGK